MNPFQNGQARLRGCKTYAASILITAIAGYGMYTGKLDYTAGMQMIMFAGIGSCLRSGMNTQAPFSLQPAPPYPTAPQSPASVIAVPSAAVASPAVAAPDSPADSYTSETNG